MHESFQGPATRPSLRPERRLHRVREFGIDSAEYTFGYVAGWGGGEGASGRIRQSGHRIQHAAQTILTGLGVAAEHAA
jgi:hypothetical protein